MTVQRENGCYSSFCPLSCVSWLMDKSNKVFFLVLGSISCAYFVHRPRPLLIFNEPRLASIILEEEEVSFGINKEAMIPMVKDIIETYAPETIFLLGSCFIEIQKIDLKSISAFLSNHFSCKFIPVELSGFQSAYSCGEDALLSSLLNECPPQPAKKKEAVIVGAVSSDCRNMLKKEFKELGIPLAGFLPSHEMTELPPVGEETLICPLHPYLLNTLNKASSQRKSKILQSLYPIGIDGTKDFFKEICAHFDISCEKIRKRAVIAQETLTEEKKRIKDKKIFIMGDNMFELPLARFLNNCGATIIETGTPYVHPQYHKKELGYLKEHNIPIVEAPDNNIQLQRIKSSNPDLVVAPLVFSHPLENMGFDIVWSVKFYLINTPIYGFDNALLLLKIFTNSLKQNI